MTFVVAPNTSGLTPLYPYESSLSQKFLPKSLKKQTPQKRLSRNRTAKVIPFYYTTKLFANFFRKKEKFIANRLNIKLFFYIFFSHKTNKSANDPNFQGNICVDNL